MTYVIVGKETLTAPFLFAVFFKVAPLTVGYAADAEAEKRWHPTKDTKEVLMPTPVPVATIIVCVQCLLLSLALAEYKMALGV